MGSFVRPTLPSPPKQHYADLRYLSSPPRDIAGVERSRHGLLRKLTLRAHWWTKWSGMNIAIVGSCLLFIAAIWTIVVVELQSESAKTIANVIRQNANLAKVFEEQTIRTIKGVDAAALFIAHEYMRLGTIVTNLKISK